MDNNILLVQSSIGYICTDNDMNIREINRYCANILNNTILDMIGSNIIKYIVIPPKLLTKLDILKTIEFDTVINITNNELRHVNISIYKHDDRYTIFVIDNSYNDTLLRDITKKNNQLEQQSIKLREYNFIVDNFIKILAHNFRNNIRPIKQLFTNSQISHYINNIVKLIDDMILYYKVFNYKVQLKSIPFYDLIKQDFITIDDSVLQTNINTDFFLLNLILTELFNNSIKFNTSDTKIVEFTYDNLGFYHKIKVSDNGNGFNMKYNKEIFKLFSKMDNDKYGTGIGLSIVEIAVNKLNGIITVDSEKNKGTTFTILLPIK